MEIRATGAKFKLEPWDGDVFVARLMPSGQFGPIVDLDYMSQRDSSSSRWTRTANSMC
jgi:hypothetical protein